MVMWNTITLTRLRLAGSIAVLFAAAIVLAELSLLYDRAGCPSASDATWVLLVTLMAFPALGAWAVITAWRPKSIWSHVVFLLLMLPALLLVETGFWRFGFGAEYYRYAMYSDSNWAGICTFCVTVGAIGAFALGVAYSARSADRRSLRGLVVGAVCATVLVVAMLNVKAVNACVKNRFAAWYAAKEDAFLGQHVRGYLPDSWRKEGWLTVSLGGFCIDDHWRWSEAQTSFEAPQLRLFLHK